MPAGAKAVPIDMLQPGATCTDVIRNVTESSLSNLRSVSELDGLFGQTSVALALLDPELRARRTNAAYRRLAGLPAKAITGRRPSEVDDGMDAALIERVLAEQVIGRGVPVIDKLLEQTLAGRRRVLSWSACRVMQNGRVLGVLCSLAEITGRAGWMREAHDLLERAGHQIGTTLDIHRTAAELADLAVPEFADRVAVDLLDQVLRGEKLPRTGAGTLPFRRVLLSDISKARARIGYQAGELITAPLASPAAAALRRGKPLLARNEAQIRAQEPYGSRFAAALLARGVHAFVAAPLIARGITLGVAMFARAERPEPYDEADVRLATDLASRAALSIDNARLYTREHNTAVTLQRSLLPRAVPQVAGLHVAHRYQPASQAAEVGGDWFDVIPLDTGQVALVVGDVAGHSIHAAAIMGQLRTTAAALARLGHPPAQIMRQLGDVVAEHGDEAGATCLYAQYDPASRRCRFTSAGHPPPALLRPDGTAGFLDIAGGVMLGVGPDDYPATDVDLPAGGVLALYTDGLVERPGEDICVGMARLARILAAGPPRSLDDLCDSALASLGAPARDDVALLLARIAPDNA
jgi:hypothetical protein